MSAVCEEIRAALLAQRDETYRAFQAKLMPGVPPERIIGVRMPVLRRLARDFAKRPDIDEFLCALPHTYCDENNLHGLIVAAGKEYAQTVARLDAFLPHVDNWATCDILSPAAFFKHRDRLPHDIDRWLAAGDTYTVRFGIEMIQTHYLDGDFDPAVLEKVAAVRSEEYYVRMMQAWFFATALTKQWAAAVPYLQQARLDPWTHNKTIRKAIESFRITAEQKQYLRTLQCKEKNKTEE